MLSPRFITHEQLYSNKSVETKALACSKHHCFMFQKYIGKQPVKYYEIQSDLFSRNTSQFSSYTTQDYFYLLQTHANT